MVKKRGNKKVIESAGKRKDDEKVLDSMQQRKRGFMVSILRFYVGGSGCIEAQCHRNVTIKNSSSSVLFLHILLFNSERASVCHCKFSFIYFFPPLFRLPFFSGRHIVFLFLFFCIIFCNFFLFFFFFAKCEIGSP